MIFPTLLVECIVWRCDFRSISWIRWRSCGSCWPVEAMSVAVMCIRWIGIGWVTFGSSMWCMWGIGCAGWIIRFIWIRIRWTRRARCLWCWWTSWIGIGVRRTRNFFTFSLSAMPMLTVVFRVVGFVWKFTCYFVALPSFCILNERQLTLFVCHFVFSLFLTLFSFCGSKKFCPMFSYSFRNHAQVLFSSHFLQLFQLQWRNAHEFSTKKNSIYKKIRNSAGHITTITILRVKHLTPNLNSH